MQHANQACCCYPAHSEPHMVTSGSKKHETKGECDYNDDQ